MFDSTRESLQALLGSGFRIRRELHGGGMSRVFVAYEPALKREVAIKVLPPDLLSTASIARFRQEIEVTAQLQHPHILPVVTTGGSHTLTYYVMPYIAGGSLRDRLIGGERPTFAQGVRLATELLAAVAFAHERGIVHRDIKPGNVLISEGHAILADFGISRALEAMEAQQEADAAAPTSTSVAAPEAYRAPERPRDAGADLYAVAVLTYEMLTGTLPENVSESAITFALLDANRSAPPERTRAVARVLARALSREPERRFASAAEFRAAIGETRDVRRGQVVSRIAVAASLLIVAGGSWWIAARTAASRPPEQATANGDTDYGPQLLAQGASLQLAAAPAPPIAEPAPALPPDPARARFDSAVTALADGDSDRARALLAAVPRSASEYARSQLQLALLDAWPGMPLQREAATRAATRALDLRDAPGALDAREIAMAEGLTLLGNRKFPEACSAFERARAMQDDYHAWMGLGECRLRDTVALLKDDGTLAFRSSYYEAALAFVEAGRRSGRSSVPYARLGSVLYLEPARVRRGWLPNGRVVLGQPVAVADSFTFDAFSPGAPRTSADLREAHARALNISREMMRPALVARTREAPADVAAREMLVELLEASGNIRESRGDGITALGEVRAARALPMDRVMAARLTLTHVRLLVRAGEFETAARVADSLLAAFPEPTERQAGFLIGPAMLTGRMARAVRLMELLSGSPTRQVRTRNGGVLAVPPAMMRERAAFTVWAALGVCNDAVRAGPAKLSRMLDALFPNGTAPAGVEQAFIERPMMLAAPCLGPEGFSVLRAREHPLAVGIAATSPGERAQVIERIQSMQSRRGAAFENSETVLTEAELYLLAGDSTGARAALSRILDALPVLSSSFVNGELGAGSLPRVMALRAELAAAEGDSTMARELAAGVVALWTHADPELQPLVVRMQGLAGQIRP